MSKSLAEDQERELERLRIREEVDRRERERSHHSVNRLVAIGTVAGAIIAFGALLVSMTKDDVPPAINISNINGDNNSTGVSLKAEPAAKASRPAATVAPAASDYRTYIDPNVRRLAGTTNVAIVLRGLPGFPPGALENAVQRALRERGFRIVPIFRNQFREDEAELRLFNGDAAFANRLKLREHCDSVLIGVLRFGGPAQTIDGGLYVREAVLEIRALDPSTGLVMDSLEIREKGGGSTAEHSSVNALSRLKESVMADVSGWSWI